MPATFPTLGAPDAQGLRGMFIADTHDKPVHIQQLTAALPTLRSVISVLFLEAFYQNQNPGTLAPSQIQEHLTARSFDWTPTLAKDLYGVSHETAAYGIEVQGIDSPLSTLWAPKMPITTRRATWRTSPMLNSKWTYKVKQYLATKTNKTFAIFGGREHGALVKQNGLPNLICFEWKDGSYQEFT